MFRFALSVALLLSALISACSPSAALPTPTAIPLQDEPVGTPTPSALEDVMRAEAERPAWFSTPLVNAETNTTFKLADYTEKTVYIEFIATWCTNCRTQQNIVRDVQTQLGNSDYVYISLSVEPRDTTAMLAQYRVERNYPWTFAVVPPDMLAALVTQFGQTVTNPPATPHLVISPTGAVSQLATGMHSAEQLVGKLTTAAGA
jgi:thiol-disulfide isomerase/thioredoxin